jgi:hypothetical protein
LPEQVVVLHVSGASHRIQASVARFQQFEVWQMNRGRWEFVASFLDFDVAYAVARNRNERVRLLKVTYENGAPVEQEIIAEVGATREQP